MAWDESFQPVAEAEADIFAGELFDSESYLLGRFVDNVVFNFFDTVDLLFLKNRVEILG